MKRKKIDIFDFIYAIIGIPWLFLMIMSSRLYSEIKIAMLLILFFVGLAEMVIRHEYLRFNKSQLRFCFFFIIYYFLSLVIGIFKGYEFEIDVDYALLQYYIFTPVCVIVLSTVLGFRTERRIFIWQLIKYLTLLLSFFDVIVIVAFRFGIKIAFLDFIMIASTQTTTELALRVSNEASFMFLLPIYIFLFFNGKTTKKDKIIYAISFILGSIYALLSGRKMLELILILAVIFSLIWKCSIAKIKKQNSMFYLKRLVMLIVFLATAFYLIETLSASLAVGNIVERAIETLTSGLNSKALGVTKRVSDTKALFAMWTDAPLFGNGLNAYAENQIANSVTQWSYEVVYFALLAQVGLVGVLLFAFVIVVLTYMLVCQYKRSKENKYIAIALGFISFIICGASNPMVYFIWPWTITLLFGTKHNINMQ